MSYTKEDNMGKKYIEENIEKLRKQRDDKIKGS